MNETLAIYANYALYSAVGVLTLAMIAYAVYLAGAVPAAERDAEAAVEADDAARSARARARAEQVAALAGAPASADPRGASDERSPSTDPPTAADPRGTSDERSGADPERARVGAGIGGALSWLGTGLLLLSLVLRGLSVERAPLGNLFEFSVAGGFFAMLAYCLVPLRRGMHWLGLFVLAPVTLLLWLAGTIWYTEAAELVPSLDSYWLVIHVSIATLATGLSIVGAVLAALFLIRDRASKRSFWAKLPAAPKLERLSYGMNVVAFPMWTFTLIAGAIWARQAWSSYWNWDPKEVWTFVIWVVYAAYLHARVTKNADRRTVAWIALAGFACIVINYTIVNFYFVGQHSYAGVG
ncbi:c-type cytochrome biogenesis protein CcsB [Marihabitans asiaticum]|uniref:Cytochrome c-type biogenesis protein CcsB n=1 Tax=Marihabitans asiaticum TaxID=415218 RepID=A0A560WI80_9MICO|nr:c-type cytochrome biogenesis protein CcsB [Marihabitans asiaticum]TWD17115.1 cytochrome c-type biogenesis protein CcsB [Marihabitans asiaticum]